MKKYIALFRGINVGGKNRLPMRELVVLLEDIGLKKVNTYIQSGNVVFSSDDKNLEDIAEKMSRAVLDHHGFLPKVLVLPVEAFVHAIDENPFPEAEDEPKSLHLYFLESEPQNPAIHDLERIQQRSEQFVLKRKVFYLHAPDGIGRSKLAARVEKSLGVSATARNWRTVTTLLELAVE